MSLLPFSHRITEDQSEIISLKTIGSIQMLIPIQLLESSYSRILVECLVDIHTVKAQKDNLRWTWSFRNKGLEEQI